MTKELYVTPVAGHVVRDPVTGKPLDAGGEYKPASMHWRRTRAEGAVKITKGPPKPAPAAKSKTTREEA